MMQPRVTIILSCFNHKNFVEKALLSVINQDYTNTEIILVDDFSSDGSIEIVKRLKKKYSQIKLILNQKNLGLCKSFNQAFIQSSGEYIVDLAADDYLFSNKITEQLNKFKYLPADYGVVYSDLIFVDEHNERLYEVNKDDFFTEGDVFSHVVARHCIYASTMLVKREVLNDLYGYDESLAYEDFDFVVRASRKWKFACVKKPLMAKRELTTSLGKQFFKKGNNLGESTLKICQKVRQLLENKEEEKALNKRLYYEAYDALRHGQIGLALRFLLV